MFTACPLAGDAALMHVKNKEKRTEKRGKV
jgi:hypothetical protein